jgi:hypothetical protein
VVHSFTTCSWAWSSTPATCSSRRCPISPPDFKTKMRCLKFDPGVRTAAECRTCQGSGFPQTSSDAPVATDLCVRPKGCSPPDLLVSSKYFPCYIELSCIKYIALSSILICFAADRRRSPSTPSCSTMAVRVSSPGPLSTSHLQPKCANVIVIVIAMGLTVGCRYDETGGFVSWRILLLNLLHFV